jgi:hypothetical protein
MRALLLAGLAVVTVITCTSTPEKQARKELRAYCRAGGDQHDMRCATPRLPVQTDCVPIYQDGRLVGCIDRWDLWREM